MTFNVLIRMTPLTTGDLVVPVCLVHTAKPEKHKAKIFTVCRTRQSPYGETMHGNERFVVCQISSRTAMLGSRHHHHLTPTLEVDGELLTSGSHRSLFPVCNHTVKNFPFMYRVQTHGKEG